MAAIEEISIEEAARDWRAFDEILDARSEAEFAEDHIPGAINLPVLRNAERAEVGTIYVQESRFRARKIGAAMVARNVAQHLETHLADKPGAYAPLVHCWRGGQRSRGMAIILQQIGWRVRVLAGGYRAYRRLVCERLYDSEPGFSAILLEGPTGAGKTEILARLSAMGAPVLDLEALAAHRGSIFGGDPAEPQPSQKAFESRIASALGEAIPEGAGDAALFLEAESSKIGRRLIPPTLWKAMLSAPAIAIEAPVEARARYSLARYAPIAADPARLALLLEKLIPLSGREQVRAWRAMAERGALEALAEDLLRRHYDPAYARSTRERRRPLIGTIRLPDLSPGALDQAAAEAMALASGFPQARAAG